MTSFEPWITGIRSDHSAYKVTAIALFEIAFGSICSLFYDKCVNNLPQICGQDNAGLLIFTYFLSCQAKFLQKNRWTWTGFELGLLEKNASKLTTRPCPILQFKRLVIEHQILIPLSRHNSSQRQKYFVFTTYKAGYSSINVVVKSFEYEEERKNTQCWPVWPDIGIKSNPNFQIDAQKVIKLVFFLKSYILHNSPKSCQMFGLVLKEKLLQRTFENRPIWSHWC